MLFSRAKTQMVEADAALPGRDTPIVVPEPHYVNGRSLVAPFPDGSSGIQEVVVNVG